MRIPVLYTPSFYIGHIATVTDVDDGSWGDEDYKSQEFSYLIIVWEEVK